MIITSQNITLGDFTFKFEFGTASRRFYITPVYFKNKIIKCEEFYTQFYNEDEWFKQGNESYLKDNDELYKITNNFHYTSFYYKKEIELSIKDKYDNKYTSIVNRESFVIFIKLLIFYYEHCNNER